ncbi:PIN domain nuclease [Candidatus Pacearchaeota archaeon]|jgi:predicted nucleic acid-binding protein|nr:PIN domain nuclease [Candidatus Pacearchaeota archaeon]|tara:strand:+ start:7987 stop:8358 length:372 start_codon:yes stop_codon:yes gene_type:complete
MNNNIFIYDTYAIVEIIEGNEKYKEYIDKEIRINDFIFAELSYILLRKNYPKADFYLSRYKKYILHVNPESIKKAMKFRYENKETRMSTTDCISYFQAKELGIKFLTGDKEFEDLENVEFVKK